MLMLELMCEASKRYRGGPAWGAVLDDAANQARHAKAMDAPDTVEDGMEWWSDDVDPECYGAVPRIVNLRGEAQQPTGGAR